MKVSIIIGTCNHFLDLLKPCLESIEEYTDLEDKEIIIVSNGSTDETVPYIEYRKKCGLPYKIFDFPKKIGFPRANNIGSLAAEGEYLLFLNDDTYIMKDTKKDLWIDWMIEPIQKDPLIGITGLFKGRNSHTEEDFILFICCMVKKTVFELVGGLDEIFSPGFMEDVDFSIKLKRKGFKIQQVPKDFPIVDYSAAAYSPIAHVGRTTFKEEDYKKIYERNGKILLDRYGKRN